VSPELESLEFGVVFGEEGSRWRELVSEERKEGNQEFAGYQGCSGYDSCGIVVIYSVVSCKTEGGRIDSVVLYLSVRL
jgi:hypothetical protein